jgi:SAM-dependent methyltransferase
LSRLKRLLPAPARRAVRARGLHLWPPLGWGRLAGLRRLEPVSRSFGYDRGTPIDRYYIEQFLLRHGGPNGDIRGRVLEIRDREYTSRFGWTGHVDASDILDVDPGNRDATLRVDLGAEQELPAATFDCIICTQTLLLVYDVRRALDDLHRLLAPGGALLLTVPGVSKICVDETPRSGDYWRFTTHSVRRLCEECFGPGRVEVEAFGNVLTAAAFLYGLAAEELRPPELARRDGDYDVIVAARAVKGAQARGSAGGP